MRALTPPKQSIISCTLDRLPWIPNPETLNHDEVRHSAGSRPMQVEVQHHIQWFTGLMRSSTKIYVYMCEKVYVHGSGTCMYALMYRYMCVLEIYTHMYVYMCIYLYIYKHTHIHVCTHECMQTPRFLYRNPSTPSRKHSYRNPKGSEFKHPALLFGSAPSLFLGDS